MYYFFGIESQALLFAILAVSGSGFFMTLNSAILNDGPNSKGYNFINLVLILV